MPVKQEYIDEITELIKLAPKECFEHSPVKGLTKESVLDNKQAVYTAAEHYQFLVEEFDYDKFHAPTQAIRITGIVELYRINELKRIIEENVYVLRSYIDTPNSYAALVNYELSKNNTTVEVFIGIFHGKVGEVKQQAVMKAKEKYPNMQIAISDIKLITNN